MIFEISHNGHRVMEIVNLVQKKFIIALLKLEVVSALSESYNVLCNIYDFGGSQIILSFHP